MPALVFQCPACKNLVTSSAAMLEPDRAGLVCSACGTTTWLPSANATGPAADAPARAPEVASVAVVVRAPTLPSGGGVWAEEERARVMERLTKIMPVTPSQVEAAEGFKKLLEVWPSDTEHKSYLKRVSLGGELAFAGQMYRAVLEGKPLDPFAKKAQNEILGLAMASMSAQRDIGSPEKSQGKNLALVVIMLILLGAAVLVGAKVLHRISDSDTIDNTTKG